MIRLTLIEQTKDQPYTVLAVVNIYADKKGTNWYKSLQQGVLGRRHILKILANTIKNRAEQKFILNDQFEKKKNFTLSDDIIGANYSINITARRTREDTGRGILYHFSKKLLEIIKQSKMVSTKPELP